MRGFSSKKTTALDDQIDAILIEMSAVGVYSDHYQKLMSDLERLYTIKAGQRQERVSRDTMALIFGNLAGILLIVAYEQKHVIISKGFGQLIRPKAT